MMLVHLEIVMGSQGSEGQHREAVSTLTLAPPAPVPSSCRTEVRVAQCVRSLVILPLMPLFTILIKKRHVTKVKESMFALTNA